MVNQLIKFILFFCLLLPGKNCLATSSELSEAGSLLSKTIVQLLSFDHSISLPNFDYLNSGYTLLNITNYKWHPIDVTVGNGKYFSLKTIENNFAKAYDKYFVVYRIDPRFTTPQTFIIRYDFANGNYTSFYHDKLAKINTCLAGSNNDHSSCMSKYSDLFSEKINVKSGDLVEISIVEPNNFFSKTTGELKTPTDQNEGVFHIYTKTGLTENAVIFMTPSQFCQLQRNAREDDSDDCNNGLVGDSANIGKRIVGILSDTQSNMMFDTCSRNLTGTQPCAYKYGQGMKISVGGSVIKDVFEPMINYKKGVLRYYSDSAGDLTFTAPEMIKNNLNEFPQDITSWRSGSSPLTASYIISPPRSVSDYAYYNKIFLGRYIMQVDVGRNIKGQFSPEIEYTIHDGTTPPSDTPAQTYDYDGNVSINAPANGKIWIRVKPGTAISNGSLGIEYLSFTGTTFISNTIYTYIIKPVKLGVQRMAKALFINTVGDASFQLIARTLMTLYIIFYAIYYLLGITTKITAVDLINTSIKFSLISVLFSTRSWEFFNNNLFDLFINGTDYILHHVIRLKTSEEHIFGFVDVIISKYTNPQLWLLIGIQLLQIFNGLGFAAIMVIYGIWIFMIAFLQILAGYLMAFISLNILISLGPIFIVLILFEKTKGMFYKWLSALFNAAFYPTLLLIFFIIIDHIMLTQLKRAVLPAKWGELINLGIYIDLSFLGIDLSFPDIELPFLSHIPFYVPTVNNGATTISGLSFSLTADFLQSIAASLTFVCFAIVAKGSLKFVNGLSSKLTGGVSGATGSKAAGKLEKDIKSIKK